MMVILLKDPSQTENPLSPKSRIRDTYKDTRRLQTTSKITAQR